MGGTGFKLGDLGQEVKDRLKPFFELHPEIRSLIGFIDNASLADLLLSGISAVPIGADEEHLYYLVDFSTTEKPTGELIIKKMSVG